MNKEFYITACMLVSAFYLNAQSGKVMTAINYIADYNTTKNSDDLITAKEAIDEASKNEITAVQGKTWYYKGIVYNLMSRDSLLSQVNPNYVDTSFSSFQKALSLDDKKFRNKKDALMYIKSISADVFNSGVDAYKENNFEKAYYQFMKTEKINNYLSENGSDLIVDNRKILSYAGSVADAAKMSKEAIIVYTRLLEDTPTVDVYRRLSMMYKLDGNKEKALSVLEGAEKEFPDNVDLVIDELNIYIEDNKLTEAIDKIDKAIRLQPENDMLYFIKGNAYDKSGDMDKAIVEYERAIKLNPKNDKALYNAGAMYFLGANKYIELMNDLDYNDTEKYNEYNNKRKELYLKARPYFEKVLELSPDDEATKKAIFKIDSALEK